MNFNHTSNLSNLSNLELATIFSNADATKSAVAIELFKRSTFQATKDGFKGFSQWLTSFTGWNTDHKNHKNMMKAVKTETGYYSKPSTTVAPRTTVAPEMPVISDIQTAITLLKTAGYMIFDSSMNEV